MMIIKKFRAEKVEDAQKMVEEQLGPEAIILTTRTVKEKGIKALFASEQLEVTAAVDESDLKEYEEKKNKQPASTSFEKVKKERKEKNTVSLHQLDDSLADIKRVLGKISQDVKEEEGKEVEVLEKKKEIQKGSVYGDPRFAKESRKKEDLSSKTLQPSSQDQVLFSQEAQTVRKKEQKTSVRPREKEVKPYRGPEVKTRREDFARSSRKLIEEFSQKEEAKSLVKEENKDPSVPGVDLDQLRALIREEFRAAQKSVHVGPLSEVENQEGETLQFLMRKGVSRKLALRIEKKLKARFGMVNLSVKSPQRTKWMNALKEELARCIKVAGPICLQEGLPTIVAFVGPSGVGKTSTLMKIATQYAVQLKKDVAVINLDESKVGAREQISAVMSPLGIPCATAQNSIQFQQAIDRFADRDLILVDTSGRSQYAWQEIEELQELLSSVSDLTILLTMSAATKDLDTYGIIQQFSSLDVDSLIFTKLDETIGQGILVNVCEKMRLPIRYLTCGKRVEGDLKIADGAEISKSILVEHNSREFRKIRDAASG